MIQIFTCEQNSPEWLECRRGIPTASNFSKILAKGEGKTRRTYLYDLAGEILSGQSVETYTNGYVERGHVQEAEARDWYVFHTDTELTRVGFVRNDELGAGSSPDSLIGDDGGLEIKTRLARLQLELLEDGRLPSEHRAQVQGNMWITGRRWWDFISYSKGLPSFKIREFRDDVYIATLKQAVDIFNAELRLLVRKFQS